MQMIHNRNMKKIIPFLKMCVYKKLIPILQTQHYLRGVSIGLSFLNSYKWIGEINIAETYNNTEIKYDLRILILRPCVNKYVCI